MIYIYTDTSVSNNVATCTSLILSDVNFIGLITEQYDNVYGSIHGELLAILQGLTHVDPKDTICVYTDSQEALAQINGTVKSDKLKHIIDSIHTYTNASFEYTKGHDSIHNPNKVVDIISRRLANV